MIYEIIICFIAGAGAGIGTGFAGMSAAAVIGPMLIVFLDMPAYHAVGVALASDVLASAISSFTYKKNGNLDVKNGIIMMLAVLVMTFVGSYIASIVENSAMSFFSIFMMALIGLKFIVKPVNNTKEQMLSVSKKSQVIRSIIAGSCVGFICGFVGAGGGMLMLLMLTSILGYELKTAVGTSVFIMTFTALTGAVSHFAFGGLPDVSVLLLCMAFTLLWARIAAKIANKAKNSTLNRVVGIILLTMCVVIIFIEYII